MLKSWLKSTLMLKKISENTNNIEKPSSHLIYSDGACSGNPGPGGWAFIHWNPNDDGVFEGSGFENNTTNNRMEMTASLEALRRVPANDSVILYTDSVYVIRGITQWVFGWKKRAWKTAEGNEVINRDLWERLLNACFQKKIDWRYIPGHKGFPGNERVDVLAVAQSQRTPLAPYSGPSAHYHFKLFPLPEKIPLPEMKNNNGKSEDKSKIFYLSYVNGVLVRHKTWEQCQACVKGVSQARFKKVTSNEEAQSVVKSWGLNPEVISKWEST